MNLPDFDDWLDDMLEGGRVQHPGEVDDDHHLVEEGAAGCLEQGGHEHGQDVQEGGAGGRDEGVGDGDGLGGGTGMVILSVKETVKKLEDGISFEKSSSSSKQKKFRIVKPRMGRGIKRDGLVQARIESLIAASGGIKLTGLVKTDGKRKFGEVNNPNGIKKAARRD